jgi:hypothetical protein
MTVPWADPHAHDRPAHGSAHRTGHIRRPGLYVMLLALVAVVALAGTAVAGTALTTALTGVRTGGSGSGAFGPTGEAVFALGVLPGAAPAEDPAVAELAEPAPEAGADPGTDPSAAPPSAPDPVGAAEVSAAAAAEEPDRIPLVGVPDRLRVFAGLSTWIDLYDVDLTPAEQVERAAAGGVQAIFVQSARFNSPADIHDPQRLAAVIERAHDRGMKVMVWYIPDHVDPAVDLRRSQAAITFTTPRGDRADGFGLDIEMETVTDIATRTAHLLGVSQALRAWAGPDYPMAAIVLPPLQLERRPGWWPDFPYGAIRPFYDVFIPMSYSSYRGTDYETTYAWNHHNITQLRVLAGDADLPIHLAGGIADNLPAVDAFVDAARDGLVIGGGLYDLHTTRAEAWEQLRRLRAPSG